MNIRQVLQPKSMPFAIGVAALLLVGAYFFPITSSIGQGVDEHIVTGWEAGIDKNSGKEMLIVDHSGEAPSSIPITGVPRQQFTNSNSDGTIRTAMDQMSILMLAYREKPLAVEEQFGTSNNAPKLFHPFSNEPIAYTSEFLKTLSKINVNPDQFGGPDIPPNTYDYSQLPGGVLQIDTKGNDNTIVQCLPGETPRMLLAVPHLRS